MNIASEGYPKYNVKLPEGGVRRRTKLNKEEKNAALLNWRAKLRSRVEVQAKDVYETAARIAPHIRTEQTVSDAAWAATVV